MKRYVLQLLADVFIAHLDRIGNYDEKENRVFSESWEAVPPRF